MDMNMTMAMYFNNNLNFYLLFEGWMVMSRGALIGSCIGWMLLAFSLEGIKGKNNSEMGAQRLSRIFLFLIITGLLISTITSINSL